MESQANPETNHSRVGLTLPWALLGFEVQYSSATFDEFIIQAMASVSRVLCVCSLHVLIYSLFLTLGRLNYLEPWFSKVGPALGTG